MGGGIERAAVSGGAVLRGTAVHMCDVIPAHLCRRAIRIVSLTVIIVFLSMAVTATCHNTVHNFT